MQYQTHVYLIRTLTNLHVGSGDSNYGVIDKEVQKDPISGAPTIYSSSLKGALREHLDSRIVPGVLEQIFGSDPGAGTARQGDFRFLNADILALPKMSEALTGPAYHLCSFSELLEQQAAKIELLDQDKKAAKNQLQNSIKDLQLIAEADFKSIYEDLPVLARNNLEDGISKNLWYEEVVPRESYFIAPVQVPDNSQDFTTFNTYVDGQVIQVGANATIGYGLCQFTKIL